MQFYKKRDFGALVSDTLNFFKLYGKNYFKNYLTLNGGIIILLVVVIVIGFGDFFKQAFGSIQMEKPICFRIIFNKIKVY